MITILGPTASGKTTLAAMLAAELGAEIISADSRQVYRRMDIGTGKDLADYIVGGKIIPYHLIDIVEPGTKYNLFEYQKDFIAAYNDIAERKKIPILCGGTGLYIEAVLNGYNLVPVPEDKELRHSLSCKSIDELKDILISLKNENGSNMHNTTDVDTVKRAIRAIEIENYYKEHPELSARKAEKIESTIIGIDINRDERRRKITERLKQRLENGMIYEVKSLLDEGINPVDLIYYGLEYKYVTEYLIGKLTYETMFRSLEIAIHQFSKRQMTWFRGMERRGFKIHWISADMSLKDKVECVKAIYKKNVKFQANYNRENNMAIANSRWGILYCPKHGQSSSMKRWSKIESCLLEQNIEFDFVQSERQASVTRHVNMLINNGYKTIIIVGGDSALNDAANCLMSVDKDIRDSIALGLIPNGVMNDFAHYWGFKENDIEQTVRWLKERRVRKIDLGCIRYTNKKNEKCHRYFLNCVNIGLISSMMNMRQQTRRLFGSRTLSFIGSMAMMMFQRLDYKMNIKINSDVIDRKVMTVCIGNAAGYGQTPNAVPYNGLLDVSVVYHPEMTQLFEGFYLLITGKFLNHHSVHPYRTNEVVVNEAVKALVSVDGRLMRTPVGAYKIAVEQEVLNFLIPM